MGSPAGSEVGSGVESSSGGPGSAAAATGEKAEPSGGDVFDVFRADRDLLYDYMALLDRVLVLPEISDVLEEQGLSRAWMRNACVAAAGRVLEQAGPDYDYYRQALELRQDKHGDTADLIFRVAAAAFAGLGAVAVLVGISGQLLSWSAGFSVWWTGLCALIVAAALIVFVIGRREGRFAEPDDTAAMTVRHQRERLLQTVAEDHLLAFIRTLLNEARGDRLGPEFDVTASPGLSEVYRSDYHVITNVGMEFEEITRRLSGGSVGIAGSRGSGKSTLIRRYCEPRPGPASGDLCCMVSAPVDYAARDFVLHLFATFCRAVVGYVDNQRSTLAVTSLRLRVRVWASGSLVAAKRLFWPAVGAALVVVQYVQPERTKLGGVLPTSFAGFTAFAILAGWTLYAVNGARWGFRVRSASPVTGTHKRLRAEARRNLARVRYLQTRTSGWSGGLTLPGGVQGQRTGSSSWAEQPLSYPEIVEQFRGFASRAAAYVAGQGRRVFVGVDELDKIGTAEQAERFLNEIKGIFGVPDVYFLVSVSDDALTSFERRGLPLRDVFDSSFDEIIRVGPLGYQDSRKLLYRRVVGLTEPYIALCHCLSGGLPRDLIRAARQVVRIGQNQSQQQPARLPEVCRHLVGEETQRKARAVAKIVSSRGGADSAPDLLELLHTVTRNATHAELSIDLINQVSRTEPPTPPEIAALRLDLAGYLYFCLTLIEVFDERLDDKRIRWATSETDHPGHIDRLAQARSMFTEDTRFAWLMIDDIRTAWALTACPPPTAVSQERENG